MIRDKDKDQNSLPPHELGKLIHKILHYGRTFRYNSVNITVPGGLQDLLLKIVQKTFGYVLNKVHGDRF